MAETKTTRISTSEKTYALKSAPTPGWRPVKGLYKKLDIVVDKGVLRFIHYDGIVPADADFASLDQSLQKGGFDFKLLTNDSPLDLSVDEDCFVILELSSNWNWRFTPEREAIRLGEDVEEYFLLRHIDDDPAIPPSAVATQNCRVINFGASTNKTGKMRPDPFNLYISFLGTDGLNLKVIIDPDIKNQGGHSMEGGAR